MLGEIFFYEIVFNIHSCQCVNVVSILAVTQSCLIAAFKSSFGENEKLKKM